MKTALEIIDETVEYYSTHKRAVQKTEDGERCKYYYRGMTCAVGRCMPKETAKRTEKENGGESAYVLHNLNERLLPEYRGHSILFWEVVQSLHDTETNWKGGKLSKEGEQVVANLKKQYA